MEDQIIHISFAKIDFKCPYCGKEYSDIDDKYVNRCNKNKNGCTNIKCRCGKRFGMTYNIMCHAVSFKTEDLIK